ncbi:hypothetical protein [Nocardia otitidiscaviarum]|uniref:hypothetical protein n=1 Tax=Nocardia otitidiscaviarum TaxID=1823 RepID=UPI000B2D1069|nr:hypothetical protein [Nocardia otitidiscaviarum]
MTEPLIREAEQCQRCRGTGEIRPRRTCPDCDGDGLIGDDPWTDDSDAVGGAGES